MRILATSILALAVTLGSAACGGAQKASSTGGGDDVSPRADRPEPGTGGADADDNPIAPGNDTGDATGNDQGDGSGG